MAFSVEEMTAWTAEEAAAAIGKLLPAGWTIGLNQDDQGWFHGEIKDAEAAVQWSDWQADRRVLLLNGFGFLWLRGQKTRHPAWRPRGMASARPNPADPMSRVSSVPDPADLDPAEVQSVYSSRK